MAFKLNKSSSSKSDKKDFPLLPDGEYPLEIEKTRGYKAKTGTKMMEVTFNVMQGEFKNRKIWRHFPLTEKAMVFVGNLLEATGSDLVDKGEFEAKELLADLKGSKVMGYVTSEELQKGPVNIVKGFKPYAQESPEPEASASEPDDDGDIFS